MDIFEVKGKVAVVTGGASGIGTSVPAATSPTSRQ
jgi:NADP-dependent 3-hydroxy acid dehydrogenase YdfG